MSARYELVDFGGDSRCKSWLAAWPVSPEIKWHYHPEFELNCVIKSEGWEHVGDGCRRFEPGVVTLLGTGVPHTWQNDLRQAPGVDTCQVLVIQFSRATFGDYFLDLPDNAALRHLLEESRRGLYLPPRAATRVRRLMEEMIGENNALRLARLLECLHLLHGADALTPLASVAYTPNAGDGRDARIAAIVAYVRDHLQDDIAQADIAARLEMTPQGFSRYFRAATGQTFVAFVNAVRVSAACERLINTSEAITDIAFCCGYNSLSNFNRQFLKHKNLSPRLYRAMHRGTPARRPA
ncbi:MAG: AraC family transcriptional regulator [Alphaproteobacteria bacterium]|nr:MAG: AraC family transcriptional regulator [Alphaproteobacteria bacterium]